jgi:hypothetical protein
MPENTSGAYAVYPDHVALNGVLQTLQQGGFDKEDICLMLSPAHPIATIVRESSFQPFEQKANVVTAGLIGWLSEFGAVVIPTFGFFIRSREFFRSLMLEQDSTMGCGHRGTLINLGFSAPDAEHFESQVRGGSVFLYLSCPKAAQTQWALELLRTTGAGEAGLLESEKAVGTAA